MDSSSLVEAEKQHLVDSFQHLSKALDQVSSTSTSYATLLAGLSSADLVHAQSGAAKIFIPPKGNALTGLLFRTPFSDSRASTVSGAPNGKRKKNPIVIDEDLAEASQSKKKRRVSEIPIPLPVAKAAAPQAPESGSDIEGTDDTDEESDSEQANVSSQSVARTPYKPLAIAAMPTASARAVPTVAAPSLARSSSSTYEEIQAQIAVRKQKERAEKLKYDINSEGSGKKKIGTATKGKAKMVTIPASALERSLSPADSTGTGVSLFDKSNDPVRQRIVESMKQTSSKKDQKKPVTSFDIPFLDSPLVVEEQEGRLVRNGMGVLKKGDAMQHSASSAPGTVTGADTAEASASTLKKKKKKADAQGKRTEFLNGMAGSSVSINSAARGAVPAAEPEAAVEAPLSKKQQKKRAKKEKKLQQAEAEAESTVVTAGKESKKKRKKDKEGNVSLREKAIMQSMPQPAESESQQAALVEAEMDDEVDPNDSAYEVAQMLTQMSSSASKSSNAAAGPSKANVAGHPIAASHSASQSSDDADTAQVQAVASASNAEKGKGKATQASQAPTSDGTSISLKGKEKEKKKQSSMKKKANEAGEALAKKRAVSASLARFASNTKGRKESKAKPIVQSRKASFPRLSRLGMDDDEEVDELASSQEKSKA